MACLRPQHELDCPRKEALPQGGQQLRAQLQHAWPGTGICSGCLIRTTALHAVRHARAAAAPCMSLSPFSCREHRGHRARTGP